MDRTTEPAPKDHDPEGPTRYRTPFHDKPARNEHDSERFTHYRTARHDEPYWCSSANSESGPNDVGGFTVLNDGTVVREVSLIRVSHDGNMAS